MRSIAKPLVTRPSVRVLAGLLVLTLSCAEVPVQRRSMLPALGRVGILPVEVVAPISIQNRHFSEGFDRWSEYGFGNESSNSPADIILLALLLMSVLTGVAGGVVAELTALSDEEVADCRQNLVALCKRIDLPSVIRDAVAQSLEAAPTIGRGPGRDSIDVVYVSDVGEPDRSDVSALLSIRVTKFTAAAPNEHDPRGPVVFKAFADLTVLDGGETTIVDATSSIDKDHELDWEALEDGDYSRFNDSAEGLIRLAAESLAKSLVSSLAVPARRR